MPILLKVDGIETSFNEEHSKKVPSLITCISDGISNFTKEEQPEKALSPIEETEEGIIRSFNEEHL